LQHDPDEEVHKVTQKLFNLNRALYEVSGKDWSDTDPDIVRVLKKLQTWPQLLQNKCSVLVGSANSGKTSEFRLQVQRVREANAHVCFVTVRELMDSGNVDDALEGPEAADLATWDKTPTETLYLFVDSIDEGALGDPRDLKACLRKLVNRVRSSLGSVTWVLSARPAVLNQEVIKVIEDALEVAIPLTARTEVALSSISQAAGTSTVSHPATPPAQQVAKVYRLAPLSRNQARTLLEDAYSFQGVDALIQEADRFGLGHHLLTPGKCKLLTKLDLLSKPPSSLGEIYERSVAVHLDAPTNGRIRSTKISREDLEGEALRLACASTLCERLNIELPSESDESSPMALSARTIVRALRESDLTYLLGSDFFEDSGHHQVKIQPDDIRFYLAARRLSLLIAGREDALKVSRLLGWIAPTGERGIFGPFMPLAGWLSALNEYFRTECMELDPQCVAFFGDLRSTPPQAAERALSAALSSIAGGERIGRSVYALTSENYWQAGASSLLPSFPKLYAQHIENDDVRELLLEIARTARSSVLFDVAFKAAGEDYHKVLKDSDLLAYVFEVGTVAVKRKLRSVALKATGLPGRSLCLLLTSIDWSVFDAKDIAKLVRGSMSNGHGQQWLSYSLKSDVAPGAKTDDLCELTSLLLDAVLTALPPDPDDSIREALHDVKWLAEVVAELLDELVGRKHSAASRKTVAGLIVKFKTQLLDRDYSTFFDLDELQESLRVPSEMRTAVVMEFFRACNPADLPAAWRVLYGGSGFIKPTLEEARVAKSTHFVDAIAQHEAAVLRGSQQMARAPRPKRAVPVSDKARKDLTRRKSGIEAGTDTNALAWFAQVLSSTSGLSRYGDVDLTEVRKAYGEALTAAVEQGLKVLWRKEVPRRDESNPRSTYWLTIAGLQGLHLEFTAATEHLPANKAELQRALDYGLYELNGVPKWYWRLVASDYAASVKFFRRTLLQAGKGAVSQERAGKVLTMLEEAPADVQKGLADLAWSAVSGGSLDQYQTDAVLSLIVQQGLVPSTTFGQEARKRVVADPRSSLTAIWSVNWMAVDATAFLAAVEAARAIDAGAADALIAAVATALEDGRGPKLLELSKKSPSAVHALKQLYIELVRVVPREGDRRHEPLKVYDVNERERAQRTRDRIPGLLAATQSTAGYVALKDLHSSAKSKQERDYYLRLLQQAAESMARQPRPMTEAEYLEFERTLQAAPGSLEAFAQRVENDILDVKEIVEDGDFSPRRFLSTNFQDVVAGAVKAMEDEFQVYLAGLLAVIGRKQYSVFREPQGADDARRDISVVDAAHGWKVTLELKVSGGGWTVRQYRDSLRNQLVRLYMRERNTTVGFFVVLKQTSSKGALLDFDALLELLRSDALQLQAERPELRLRVIGIDATEPLKADGTLVRTKAAPKALKDARKAARKTRRAVRSGAASGAAAGAPPTAEAD
jgi:hypothetical protein